jgi:DnaK suppressor protein
MKKNVSSVKTAKKASVSKKLPAKKPTAVKKPAAAKKTVVKKPTAKVKADQPKVKSEEKKVVSVQPLKVAAEKNVRRAVVISKPQQAEAPQVDTAKAIAFAMSIAEEMKRNAAKKDNDIRQNEIKLSRRPTSRTQKGTTEKFPAADLKEFKKRLLAARDKAVKGVDAMKATGFNESEDHEADGGDGTNQTLRLQALGQMGNMNRMIQQIEEALHRIDDGSYGVCTACGQLIRKPRLMNQPFVLTCMECQSEMERGQK